PELIRNLSCIEFGNHLRGIFDAHIRKKQCLGLTAHAQGDEAGEAEHGHCDQRECCQPGHTQGLEKFRETAHEPTSSCQCASVDPFLDLCPCPTEGKVQFLCPRTPIPDCPTGGPLPLGRNYRLQP